MNRQPLVSIVVSTYREAEKGLLQEAIASVRAQTCPDWECVIVGDATPDAPLIEGHLAELNDPRLRFFNRTENAGAADSGTKPKQDGVRLARGEFLCFLDADDAYTPSHLQSLLTVFDRHPDADLAFGDSLVRYAIAPGARPITFVWRHPWNAATKRRMMEKANFLSSSDPMMRRSSYEVCGGIQNHGYLNDWRLWQSFIATGRDRFYHVPEVLTLYRAGRAWQFLFLRYLAAGLPFDMEGAARKGQIPGQSRWLTWLHKGPAKPCPERAGGNGRRA